MQEIVGISGNIQDEEMMKKRNVWNENLFVIASEIFNLQIIDYLSHF
jgi:hypothetical protein